MRALNEARPTHGCTHSARPCGPTPATCLPLPGYHPYQTVWAYSKLGLSKHTLLLAAAAAAGPRAPRFDAQSIATMAWAFANLEVALLTMGILTMALLTMAILTMAFANLEVVHLLGTPGCSPPACNRAPCNRPPACIRGCDPTPQAGHVT